MNLRRFGLLILSFALCAGSLLLGQDLWNSPNASSGETESPRGAGGFPSSPAGRLIYASGVVEGTQRDVSLRFEVTGRVETIHVREGATVEKGDILAELESQPWEQRVAEAAARLKLAQAERERLVNGARPETLEVLMADTRTAEVHVHETEALYSRAKQLAQRNSLSAQELDDNRFKHARAIAVLETARSKLAEVRAPARTDELNIAEARIALAEATLRHERSLLERTRIRAPIDGLVLHVLVETGELVGPDDERSLITMTNRDRTRVRAYVEELDSLAVAPGQATQVTVDGQPGRKYMGTIHSCSLFVRGKSQRHHKPGELVDIKVREVVIELQDADELIIGLPVDVFIDPSEGR